MHACRKPDENRVCAGVGHEGAQHDRAQTGDQFELACGGGRKPLGQPFALASERDDGRDLPFGVAAEDVAVGGFSVGPERRHQRPGPVRRWIDQVLAQPAGLQPARERGDIDGLNTEGRAVAPAVTRDATDTAERAE